MKYYRYLLTVILLTASLYGKWEYGSLFETKEYQDMTQRSIDHDSEGNPHVVYGEKHLYHSYMKDNIWHTEVVDDTDNVGKYASIAIDNNDVVHISYYATSHLNYANNSGGTWSIQMIESVGSPGSAQTSIAIDSTGKFHIIYYYIHGDKLKHAYYDDTFNVTRVEIIDADTYSGLFNSLAIDANDNLHVAYYDAFDGHLKYAIKVGSAAWDIQTLDSTDDVGSFCSIAVDGSGYSYISYYDDTNKYLKYITNKGSNWASATPETVDGSGDRGSFSSIALHSGVPYISYYDDVAKKPYVAYKSTSWVRTKLSDSAGEGLYSSIASNPVSGDVDIVYHSEMGQLYTTHGTTNSYSTPLIIDNTLPLILNLHRDTRVETDQQGYLHLTYFDSSSQQLKYSNNRLGHWIESTIDYGNFSSLSLAVDGNGKAHISYYELGNKDLKYASNFVVSHGWYIFIMDDGSGADVGKHNDITVNSSGIAHMSYLDATNQALKYIRVYGSGPEVVENGNVGAYNSITLDSSENVHIAYADDSTVTGNGIKYAHNTSGSWVDASVYPGYHNSNNKTIAIDSNNKVHILHAGVLGGYKLFYTHNIDGTWKTEIADDAEVWDYTLNLDAQGKAHLSYHTRTNTSEVTYATNHNGKWQKQVLNGDALMTDTYCDSTVNSSGKVTIVNKRLNYVFGSYSGGTNPALIMYLLQ